MKSRGLIVAVVVLAALTGTLYWSNHRKPAETNVSASAEATPKILALDQADISELVIKKKGAEDLTLVKNGAGKWQITAPHKLSADQEAVSSMLSTLSSLNSDRLIEDKATNLDAYGLSQPSLELDVTGKNKKTDKLMIGDETPTSGGAYAAVAGDPRVFTLATYNKNSLDKGVKDLRDRRLMTFETDKVTRIELQAKKQTIEFGRNKEQWQIVKPGPFRADGFQVDDLLRKLGDAKMDLTANDDPKKLVAAFNSATPVATAKVTDASGTQEFQLRKNKDDYYAKSSAVEGVYKVTGGIGSVVAKGLDDFRDKKLFDFGYSDPEKIEIHDGAKSYSFSRNGNDWSSNGAKMDEISANSLVGKVRDLSASKFVDKGFAAPAMDVTVTSNDGKRVEKVLIAKNGGRYIAKRENEPALYELNASDVTAIQKSAEDIKPAPAPAAAAPKK